MKRVRKQYFLTICMYKVHTRMFKSLNSALLPLAWTARVSAKCRNKKQKNHIANGNCVCLIVVLVATVLVVSFIVVVAPVVLITFLLLFVLYT